MISEMCVKYGSSGVKGQRPLRFLGDPKGAILTLRMALFEIAAAGGCIGRSPMDLFPLWNSLRIAAIIPLGCRPTGALNLSLPGRK